MGYTVGCRRCRLMRDGLPARGVRHTPACRQRLHDCLREAQDPRLAAAEARVDAEVARRLERSAALPEEEEGRRPPAQASSGPAVRGSATAGAPTAGVPASSSGTATADTTVAEGSREGGLNREASEPATPERVRPEADEDSDMVGLLAKGMPRGVASDFVNVYELLLISGAPVAEAKKKVCELFSPPRVTQQAARYPRMGSIPGLTFDLVEDAHGRSWDFLRESDRREARRLIEAEKPYLVVGSPRAPSSAG